MSRIKTILASTIAALASIASYASLYMFHFGMIKFWILPVVCVVCGLFLAVKKITENSEKDFNRGDAIKLYVFSAIFSPFLALLFPSFVFKSFAVFGFASLIGSIYELYKGERIKGTVDLIETLMKNPKDFEKEFSLYKTSFLLQAIAGVALSIFNIVGYCTISSEIFIPILLVICVASVVVELIKDIALPSSKLENTSGGQTFNEPLPNVST